MLWGSKARAKERLVVTGLSDVLAAVPHLGSVFPGLVVVQKETWTNWRLASLLALMQKLRLAGSVGTSVHRPKIRRLRALFPIFLLDEGYYQDERLSDGEAVLRLRDEIVSANREAFVSLGLSSKSSSAVPTCFVHVRRGDYLEFPSKEHPAALPLAWYLDQIRAVRQATPQTRFLIFSDDAAYCRQNFEELENSEIVEMDAAGSFAAMSLCDAGILSPSSLSWWSARIASNIAPGPFIAPSFWFWWPQQKWIDDTVRYSTFLIWKSASGE